MFLFVLGSSWCYGTTWIYKWGPDESSSCICFISLLWVVKCLLGSMSPVCLSAYDCLWSVVFPCSLLTGHYWKIFLPCCLLGNEINFTSYPVHHVLIWNVMVESQGTWDNAGLVWTGFMKRRTKPCFGMWLLRTVKGSNSLTTDSLLLEQCMAMPSLSCIVKKKMSLQCQMSHTSLWLHIFLCEYI